MGSKDRGALVMGAVIADIIGDVRAQQQSK